MEIEDVAIEKKEVRPGEFKCICDELVTYVEGINLDQCRYDHEVAILLENRVELGSSCQQRRKTILEDVAVFAVQKKSSVDDVEKQDHVVRPVKVRFDGLEQLQNKLHPSCLEHHVGRLQLDPLEGTGPGLIEYARQGLSGEGVELNQLVVNETVVGLSILQGVCVCMHIVVS